jgi:ABC-type phosphate/phosphonate transport system permease subunit
MNTMMETNFVARQIVNERILTVGHEPIVLAYPNRPLQKIAKRVMAFIRSIDEAMQAPMLALRECTLAQVGC